MYLPLYVSLFGNPDKQNKLLGWDKPLIVNPVPTQNKQHFVCYNSNKRRFLTYFLGQRIRVIDHFTASIKINLNNYKTITEYTFSRRKEFENTQVGCDVYGGITEMHNQ